jgi:hypothetical protein
LAVAAGIFVWFGLSPAEAVVIDTLTGTGNTSAPSDDPGWANVGIRGIGTGVYLGGGWVLTASHVGGGEIVLGSGTYAMLPDSGFQLTNGGAAGKTAATDLYMYRLTTDPGLPAISIGQAAPAAGSAVTLIGAGRDRGAFTTCVINTSVSPYLWTETSVSPNAAGYQELASRSMRWGTNAVSLVGWDSIDGLDVAGLRTDFTFSQSYSSEAQAAVGDSGGGVFRKNGSVWELAGIMLGVGTFSGQPANTAVFGNVTAIADLSVYRAQIMQVVPEPGAITLALGGVIVAAFFGLGRPRSW